MMSVFRSRCERRTIPRSVAMTTNVLAVAGVVACMTAAAGDAGEPGREPIGGNAQVGPNYAQIAPGLTRPPTPDLEFDAILNDISKRCPSAYPEEHHVLPLPDEAAELGLKRLTELLGHWDPGMRRIAASELTGRGTDGLSAAVECLTSDDWQRRAGGAAAVQLLRRHNIRNPSALFPEAEDSRSARRLADRQFQALAPKLIPLLKDERGVVRAEAMRAVAAIGMGTPGVAEAILRMATDPNEFIGEEAMSKFSMVRDLSSIDVATRIEGLTKAFDNPRPRGRGDLIKNIIRRLPKEEVRQLVPVLMANAAWEPRRDMMFALAGRDESIRILARLRVTEFASSVPDVMRRGGRGSKQIRQACAEYCRSMGPEAKAAAPGLKQYLGELSADADADLVQTVRQMIAAVSPTADNAPSDTKGNK